MLMNLVWINLPISGLAGILILIFLDVKHEHTSFVDGMKAIDWLGLFTFLGCTLMILLGLDFGGVLFPWDSAKIIALLVVGGVMVFAFVYSEAKFAKYPLIPMSLFKTKTNIATFLVVFFHGFVSYSGRTWNGPRLTHQVFIAAEFYMPLFLQSVLEASPLRSGVLLLPLIVTGAVFGVLCGVIIHRTGRYREIMWVGSFFMCLGYGLFISFDASTTTGRAVGFQMIAGLGQGILFEAPLIAIQSQVKQDDVATATATMAFVRNIAVSISVIVCGTIFQNSMTSRNGYLRAAGLPEDLLMQLDGENALANVALPRTLDNPAWEFAAKSAFAWATRNMWIMLTVLAFLCLVASFFVDAAHLGTEHVETVTGLRKEKEAAPPVDS